MQACEIVGTAHVCWRGGKGELCVGPGKQAHGCETAKRGAQMLAPSPPNEPMEFCGSIDGNLVRLQLATPRPHLVGGKPDP